MFMVSLRSFPWNGNVPVSISNCKHTTTVREWNQKDFLVFSSYKLQSMDIKSECVCVGLSYLVYHKHSQRPPVCTLCVSSPVDHLRGHILHRTTEWISLLISIYWLFAQAKVCRTAKQSKMVRFTADWTVTYGNYTMQKLYSLRCLWKKHCWGKSA